MSRHLFSKSQSAKKVNIGVYRIYVKVFFSFLSKKVELILINKFLYNINDIAKLVTS